jgi:type I restriction enzyme S subunit
MMRTYDSYKDSGIEWIGEIPRHWELKSIKYISDIVLGKMLTNDNKGNMVLKPYLRSFNIQNNRLDMSDVNEMWFSNDELKKLRLQKGDLLLNEGGDVGRTVMWNDELDECYIQNSVNRVRVIHSNPHYIKYVSILYHGVGYYDSIVSRVSIPHLTKDKLENVFFILPPLFEQDQIVTYLDEKTSLIDEMVEKKKRKIELLKEYRTSLINTVVTKGLYPDVPMKDSGIEWIGEIPRHWVVSKVKYTSKVFGRIGYRGYTVEDLVDENEGCITISPGNIYEDVFNLNNVTYLSWEKYHESPEIMIFEGDIIIVKTGSTIGKTCIIPSNVPEMTINPQLIVLKNIQLNKKYMYYLTTCKYFKKLFSTEQTGGTTPTISQEKINDFCVLIPQLNEQEQIVSYLDEKTSEIDKTIELEKKKIELLKEYRQSLISNVVTGKIKVVSE